MCPSAFCSGATLRGTFYPRCTHPRPHSPNAWSTFRTVCGAQCKLFGDPRGFLALSAC